MVEFNQIKQLLRSGFGKKLNLHLDKADEKDVIEELTKNSDFIGANLWTLIFAIFIASIGLNMNSTAVIIGAMLISPLMGPIMGVGLGIGINDFELVKKAIRNLLIASIIGIITSTVYFLITPIDDVQSELLARTTPSVWDVFIAFFGGLAGIVAATRKVKNNVIPGVAIATALMPPLCTAGYGLATGHIYYFLGALYLYSINSVFICISTFLIIRFLKFKKKQFDDKKYEEKVSRYIIIIIIVTILPSIYLTYRIVQKSIFENNADLFVKEQFKFKFSQVVNKTYSFEKNTIDLLLIGYELPESKIDSLEKNLNKYGLQGTKLIVKQGLNAKQEIDLSQIKASILEDVFRSDSVKTAKELSLMERKIPVILHEFTALYPTLNSYSASWVIAHQKEKEDTLMLVVASFEKPIGNADRLKLQQWLKTRLLADSLRLIVE